MKLRAGGSDFCESEPPAATVKSLSGFTPPFGYLVSFYCLDGYTDSENQGWDEDYNFGSLDAARTRWNAVFRAHADFISTDQYETVAALICPGR